MKTPISSSVYGLVPVPPTPETSAVCRQLRGTQSCGLGNLPEPNRNSPKLMLSAAAFGIALAGTVMVALSVRAVPAPPITNQPPPF